MKLAYNPVNHALGPGIRVLPAIVRQERRLRIAQISQENFLELIGHLQTEVRRTEGPEPFIF